MSSLSASELIALIQAVFPSLAGDKSLAIFVDIPPNENVDTPAWGHRREIAMEWSRLLQNGLAELNLESVDLVAYEMVHSNNADLPEKAYFIQNELPQLSSDLPNAGLEISFDELFESTDLILAPTQQSATAPLKVAAKKYQFRAATMPGFSAAMIPALRIDYNAVNDRVNILKEKLDVATSAKVKFVVDGSQEYEMFFDLRNRPAHASGGRFPEPGTAGNLPSGETYIVPYEGENDPSQTSGTLPVQFDDEIVLFEINENKATQVISTGEKSKEQSKYLQKEPAYGNMAELGFGVLADFGLKPIGEVLLDEKLGFHIAFGRSDHFGGITGPDKFSSPQLVVHIDRIYIPETQPRISIEELTIESESDNEEIIRKNKYLIF
jgi:hypothetical protein